MKKLILTLLILSPLCLKAQAKKDFIYFIDNKKASNTEMEAIPPGDIEEAAMLKYPDTQGLEGAGNNDVMLLLTHKFVIASYQEKFSGFSDDYESYLTSHGTDDKQFVYQINARPIRKDKGEALTLYRIKKENIESVTFTQNEPEGSKILARVIIKTKN